MNILHCVVVAFVLSASSVVVAGASRLPGGSIAEVDAGLGARKAWYERPTTRYDHGVLGDAIEGGSLVVIDGTGKRFEHVLSQDFVFEDITPRIADLDGNGHNEVVTIRSSLRAGAAVAVYEVIDGRLSERASTAPIGKPYRWLSIAGIADFRGDGAKQIAVIKTPHIAGQLELLALRGHELVSLLPPHAGVTSHFIGAAFTSFAAVGVATGHGRAELVVADQTRRRLKLLNLYRGVEELSDIALPARVSGPIVIEAARRLRVPVETGSILRIELP